MYWNSNIYWFTTIDILSLCISLMLALTAPTVKKQMDKAKKKEDAQAKKIAQLTEERDSLLEQLSQCKYFS